MPPGPVRVSRRTSGAAQQRRDRRQLALAADQRRRLRRQVVGAASSVSAAGSRPAGPGATSWKMRSGRIRSLRRCSPRSRKRRRPRAGGRAPAPAPPARAAIWPPWPASEQAGDAVERRAEVVAVALLGRAGVQRHAHPQRPELAPVLRLEARAGRPAAAAQRRRARWRRRRRRRRPTVLKTWPPWASMRPRAAARRGGPGPPASPRAGAPSGVFSSMSVNRKVMCPAADRHNRPPDH